MRIDWYTKAVLTVIAGLLGVIAAKDYLRPEAVQAQGAFSGVVPFVSRGCNFFDARTGEIWKYDDCQGKLVEKFRVTKLGQPIVVEK